ncbi:MAG: bifunctional DNA primase/polymerase [Bryobacteraceae bacterium]
MTTLSALDQANACLALGWSFTPLNGKIPLRKNWQNEPPLPLSEFPPGCNIGLRTGRASGVVVVDLDPGAEPAGDLPPTVTVETGRGRHLYYHHDAPLRNSAGKLGPHVDLRADGGQVVFPGSTHPTTGAVYRFTTAPWDITLAPLPAWIPEKLTPQPKPSPRPISTNSTPLARHALRSESNAVRAASEGTRNDTLNTAAFNLGQLIAGGQISQGEVEAELTAAGVMSGLLPGSVAATIKSGIEAGMQTPRYPKPRATAAPPDPETTDTILIPGTHTDDNDRTHEVSTADFANNVLRSLPDDLLYSRSHLPGELHGDVGHQRWAQLSSDRMRLLIDSSVRLGAWVKLKPDAANPMGPTHSQVYRTCNRDLAGLVIAGAENSTRCREIDLMVSYPAYGPGWRLAVRGWQDGVYYDEPPELAGISPCTDLEAIHTTFAELICDFPFADIPSRQNFLGLLLTPLVARAIGGNRPLHLITSSLERTGKTKLAEDVFGGIIMGDPTPAMQFSGTDEERDKRILSILLKGNTLLHLDNLPRRINSAALASLLTTVHYEGRLLGSTRILSLRNWLTIVATGNNTTCTGEIAKRTVPIVLQPTDAEPENRTNFQHPDLSAHVRKNRRLLLSCLLGMIQIWIDRGRPPHAKPMGGFEGWSRTIGGVLNSCGFHQWRNNESDWRQQYDDDGIARLAFVEAWWDEYHTSVASPKQLLKLALDQDLLPSVTDKPTERAQQTMMGYWLKQHINTPIGRWRVGVVVYGSHRSYALTELRRA